MQSNTHMKTQELVQERNELNALIGRGVSFEVEDTEIKETPRLFGLFKKREVVSLKRTFTIEEPTLGTLDRLSSEWLEMELDERKLQGEDGLAQARKMTKRQALRCAKVIAIAVLGTDILIPKIRRGGIIKYEEDTKRLEKLTDLFARTITPSELLRLYLLIGTMCNLGDFMNSIRLMSANRTTVPIQIEDDNEA